MQVCSFHVCGYLQVTLVTCPLSAFREAKRAGTSCLGNDGFCVFFPFKEVWSLGVLFSVSSPSFWRTCLVAVEFGATFVAVSGESVQRASEGLTGTAREAETLLW